MMVSLIRKISLMALFLFPTIGFGEQLVSSYQAGFGQMIIEGGDEGQYLFKWDRNTCFFDSFGEVAGCTKMAVLSFQSTAITELREEKNGVMYIRYKFPDTPEFAPYRLVLKISEDGVIFRLVEVLDAGTGNGVARVIPLEKRQTP